MKPAGSKLARGIEPVICQDVQSGENKSWSHNVGEKGGIEEDDFAGVAFSVYEEMGYSVLRVRVGKTRVLTRKIQKHTEERNDLEESLSSGHWGDPPGINVRWDAQGRVTSTTKRISNDSSKGHKGRKVNVPLYRQRRLNLRPMNFQAISQQRIAILIDPKGYNLAQ